MKKRLQKIFEFVKNVAIGIFIVSAISIAGATLYLFGVEVAFFVAFGLGVATGAYLAQIWLFRWLRDSLVQVVEAKFPIVPLRYPIPVEPSVPPEEEAYPTLLTLQRMPRYVGESDVHYIVWREQGEPQYVFGLDPDDQTVHYSNEDPFPFAQWATALLVAEGVWRSNGCAYPVSIGLQLVERDLPTPNSSNTSEDEVCPINFEEED